MRPLCQRLQRQGFNGNGRSTERPYSRYSSRRTTTDEQVVRPYTSLLVSPPEEIGNLQGENENSPRNREIKVRKNEMKLRKKQIEVPKIFFIPPWRISVCYRGIFDFLGGVVSGALKGIGVPRNHQSHQNHQNNRTSNL